MNGGECNQCIEPTNQSISINQNRSQLAYSGSGYYFSSKKPEIVFCFVSRLVLPNKISSSQTKLILFLVSRLFLNSTMTMTKPAAPV